jgi:hypothetical protein
MPRRRHIFARRPAVLPRLVQISAETAAPTLARDRRQKVNEGWTGRQAGRQVGRRADRQAATHA